MNLPTLPMSREEFWRQYWDRIDVPVLGYTMELPVPGDGCWTWTGAKNATGYGTVQIQKKTWLVHRVAHWVFNEELQPELWVLNSCNNPPCINPLHLRQGAPTENYDEMLRDYDVRPNVITLMEGRSANGS